jgi:hypothetical protein
MMGSGWPSGQIDHEAWFKRMSLLVANSSFFAYFGIWRMDRVCGKMKRKRKRGGYVCAGKTAWSGYKIHHKQNPDREFYIFYTSKENIEVVEEYVTGVRGRT